VARLQLIVATLVLVSLVGPPRKGVAAPPSKTIVFEGTVTSIRTVENGIKSWLITTKVTRVVSGEFSRSKFEFVVHSPALSGLEKGRSYTIEAVRNGDGYIVDEHQWRRPKRLQVGLRSSEPSNLPLQRTVATVALRAPSRARR
jgi:hypothetical protein